MNLGQFIDTFKGRHRPAGGGVYPPLYRPSENGHKLPACSASPWGAGGSHKGAALSLEPTGAPPSSARWAPARPSSPPPQHIWRASSGSWSSARPTWSPSGSGRWR